jgi:hypothetical protein
LRRLVVAGGVDFVVAVGAGVGADGDGGGAVADADVVEGDVLDEAAEFVVGLHVDAGAGAVEGEGGDEDVADAA